MCCSILIQTHSAVSPPPAGGAGASVETQKITLGKFRARPTLRVLYDAKHDFGYAFLVLLPMEATDVRALRMPSASTRRSSISNSGPMAGAALGSHLVYLGVGD